MSSVVDLKINSNMSLLNNLQKSLNARYFTRVGILGKTTTRPDDAQTNAEIGLKQEFGSITQNIPPRSFIRMPLTTQIEKIQEGLKKIKIIENAAQDKVKRIYEMLGLLGEEVIQEAFSTAGFGQWKPNSPYTIAKKGSSAPLIDTGELRKSITSDVVKKI